MSKSPTIHDLAADLNISATTVWRALNNRDRVSAKTRELVRARAQAINYEPSLVAQNLSVTCCPVTGRPPIRGCFTAAG